MTQSEMFGRFTALYDENHPRVYAYAVSRAGADDVTERLSVLHAITMVSEADQELLTLVAWHGLSTRDAARVVGCSVATYFVRLHRARRRLAEAMDPAADEPAADGRRRPPAPTPADTLPKAAEEISR